MHAINADMHCHSTASDGWLSPEAVVERAHGNGVDMLALTDHDTTAGLPAAVRRADQLGLHLVPGVEISVTHVGETIHIVGLGIDPEHRGLSDGLSGLRAGRQQRARRMSDALEACGIRGVYEGALRFAQNPEMVGRAHFARHLVASGLMPDVSTVFRHYLAKGKPGFVEHEWARLSDAVGWIRAAGGVAVVAHPGRYRLDKQRMAALFDDFVDCGGEAVEVVSGSHSPDQVRRFATVARQHALLASRASDFHGEQESPVDLGGCVALPDDLQPVWSRLRSFNS